MQGYEFDGVMPGSALPAELIASIQKNKVALKGPVTTPIGQGFTSVNVGLRKALDLYANLRPAQCFDALADFSSLKPEVVAGLDILIVRELTSGVYFGEPRGIHSDDNNPDNEGGRVGINTQRYTSGEIRRVVGVRWWDPEQNRVVMLAAG